MLTLVNFALAFDVFAEGGFGGITGIAAVVFIGVAATLICYGSSPTNL